VYYVPSISRDGVSSFVINQEALAKFCYFTNLVLLLGELGGIGTVFLFNKLATFHNRNKFHLFITLYLFVLFCFLVLEGLVFVLMCLFLSLGFSVFND
jgi:hypothetical protein